MKNLIIIFFIIVAQNSYSDEYTKSEFEIMDYLKNCNGSGIEYRSKYFDLVSLYKDFQKIHPNCEKIHQSVIDDIEVRDFELKLEVEKILRETKCDDLKNGASIYLAQNKAVHNKIKQKEHWLIKQAKKLSQEKEIQIEKSHIAWNLLFCSSADINEISYPKLDFLKALDSLAYNSEPAIITTNGEYSESCKNIQAEGSDDLESFKVSLANAKGNTFHVSYNTFSVEDAIKIKNASGKVIHDSGCIGTNFNKEVDIEIPKGTNKDISIFVDGSCSDNSTGTYWKIQINCESPQEELTEDERQKKIVCDQDVTALRKSLKEYINLSIAKREHIWMRSICQENHYKQVVDRLINSKSYFGNLTNVPKKKIKTHKSLTLSGPPIREISSTMDSVSTPKKPTLFVYGKEDFKNNKKQYCPPKPDKDTNIFKVISYSYCQNGFERLF